MGYLAIARKWRPCRFEALVGQNHVVQTLKNAIAFNRVTHAYLFSGARGVGKTSVARIFATALRCPNAKDGIPCNECEQCQSISESRSIDVVEIDGASNNGVEAVRGIRENVAYSASSGTYKIYIIDEVHMLSLSAFNALLKTLEEPPPHIIFIFATTEAHKIPPTILSRCQHFEFRRLTNQQIVGRLREILEVESLSLTEDALCTIASYGDGSLRDALSLLDQVLSYCGQTDCKTQTLDEKKVVEALGLSDTNTVTTFLSDILNKKTSSLIQLIGEIYQGGMDLKRFAERCLEELRLLYLITLAHQQNEPITAESLDISASRFSNLEQMAKLIKLVQLERMSQILGKTISQLGWSSLPRFVLEMAAVRMSQLDQLSQIESTLLKGHEPTATEPNPERSTQTKTTKTPKTTKTQPPQPPASLTQQSSSYAEQYTQSNWKSFVDVVMKKRPLLGALLCHGEFKMENSPEGQVALLTFAEESFYERQAMDKKNRSEIQALLKQHFGKNTKLQLSSAQKDQIQSIAQKQQEETAEIKKAAKTHPTVKQMEEKLGAEIIDVNIES